MVLVSLVLNTILLAGHEKSRLEQIIMQILCELLFLYKCRFLVVWD